MKIFQKNILLLFSFYISLNFSNAQEKADYTKKFTEGSFLMLEENYRMALKNFLAAYQLDSSGANINYKIGFCFFKIPSERYKAEKYLEKAALNTSKTYDDIEPSEKKAPIEAFLYLAQAQHLSGKFDEAIANFEKYKTFISPKKVEILKEIDRQIETSKNARVFTANPSKILITNIGDTVNSSFPDYSPVISADESVLAFTSRRESSTGGLRTISNEYFEDIFISHKKEDGTWSTPVSIDENVNTNGNEATINITADGQQLLIYKDDNGDGNIYISNLEGDRWSVPTKLGSDINSKYWETHACISADGNSLYFVSDRPGGYGGRDVYKSVKLPNGSWSLSKNLGPIINTPYDEDGVFIHPDQVTLFFSSKGHNTMGGFDIFYSSATDEGKWTEPTNIGYPTNTGDDDIFYVVSTDGKRAYYSSIKADGYGEKDIYMISLEEGAGVRAIALLVGKIIIPEGEVLTSNNEITVTNVETGQVGIYKANTKTGKYVLSLIPGKTYEVSYMADDKEFYHETLTVPAGTDYQEIERAVPLKPVALPEGIGSVKSTTEVQKPVEEKKSVEEKKPVQEPVVAKKTTPTPAKRQSAPTLPGSVIIDAIDDEVSTDMNQPVSGSLMSNDKYPSDIDMKVYRGPLSFPRHGWVSVKNNGEFVYTPNRGYVGQDSFTYLLYWHGKWQKYRDTATVTINVTQNMYYDIYFKYNVYEIDPQSDRFNSFINEIKSQVEAKGSASLTIESSASHVPTRKFKTNEKLADSRSKEAKEKVLNVLKSKGIDESKIVVHVKNVVQGPQYDHDYDTNKAVYEKYQYIKIYADK